MDKKGFSLIEIIVAIALLGIIAVTTLPLITSGYIHIFDAKKYTVDTFAIQQQVEEQMEIARNSDILSTDPSKTLAVFGKTITGHLVKVNIQSTTGTAHGQINVFVPKYKVVYTVPEIASVTVQTFRDKNGVLSREYNTGNIFPLAVPGNYVELKGLKVDGPQNEFLMNVYRWYMSPVLAEIPNKSDLILIKEWNEARTPLSFAEARDLQFTPNVEANYDSLDFRELYTGSGLSEAEICAEINDTYSGRYFYYSVTPYSTIGRMGVEKFSSEIVSTNKVESIDEISDRIPVNIVYYPKDHYPTVPALMQDGTTMNVPVIWNPSAITIPTGGQPVDCIGTVIGYPPGAVLHLSR